eukprot:4402478-Karenia_brevis.AAC.1
MPPHKDLHASTQAKHHDKDLHAFTHTKHQVKSALVLDVIVRDCEAIHKLLARRDKTLIIIQSDCLAHQGVDNE